jgi:hypothetical protein
MPSDTPTVMHQNRVVFPRTHIAIRCIKKASPFREGRGGSMHQTRVVFPRKWGCINASMHQARRISERNPRKTATSEETVASATNVVFSAYQ